MKTLLKFKEEELSKIYLASLKHCENLLEKFKDNSFIIVDMAFKEVFEIEHLYDKYDELYHINYRTQDRNNIIVTFTPRERTVRPSYIHTPLDRFIARFKENFR